MSSLSHPLFSARIVLVEPDILIFLQIECISTSGIKVDLAEENTEFMEGRYEKWC